MCLVALALIAAASHAQEALPGRAFYADKILTAERTGPGWIDHGVMLVQGERILAVGKASQLNVPAHFERIDCGSGWIMPGMIDLHSHIGGSLGDINDMVLQLNAGLRVNATVVPRNDMLLRALAEGVTTVLYIPGSGTNMGGAGLLLKTSGSSYERMLVRDPGSLKIAQGDNPTRWGYGMGRSLMNYHIRTELARGGAYARERVEGTRERDPRFDIFPELFAKRTQVSTHTQIYQLVMQTIRIIRGEFGVDVYIDHGEFLGYLATEQAIAAGVSAICGPRIVDNPNGRLDTDGRVQGVAAGYQQRGMPLVGFNTDAPVVPGEELALQAGMSGRYGFETDALQAVRGLTIVPAIVAGIDARVGSLEPGKEADFVILRGDPADPRCAIDAVWVQGEAVYSAGVHHDPGH